MFRPALILSFVVLSGCATASTGSSGSSSQTPRRDPNVISAEELAQSPESDLSSAIKRLRPSFFETRGSSSLGIGTVPEAIQVYIDGTRAGSLDALSQIRPSEVKEVRRLSATDATQRFGTNHTMGAILVSRK